MSESFDRVRDALDAVGSTWKAKGSDHLMAQCPAHEDSKASLSIHHRHDRTLLRCFADCPVDSIVAVLGLELADLFDDREAKHERGMVIRSYVYTDYKGDPWIIKDRLFPKSFMQRLPGTEPGDYRGLKGRPGVLYHLPQLRKGISEGRTPFLVEGEKDVETAERHGLLATCVPSVSGPWEDGYTATLARAEEVIVVADQDKTGREFAQKVRTHLRAAGVRVRIMRAKEGKDLTDHFDHGHTVDDLVLDTSTYTRPRGMTGDVLLDQKFPPIRWSVPRVLPAGLAILAASPKAGKALAVDTPLLTANRGWITMGEVEAGDTVFTETGEQTHVSWVSPIRDDRECYRVTTRSGAVLVADAEHQWAVYERGARAVVTTRQLLEEGGGRSWLLPEVGEAMKPDPVVRQDAIESVERVDSVPVRCLAVEHPLHTFLAGRELTVTHNSWLALDIGLAVAAGGTCLGALPANRGSVLYLAREDGYRRVQSRMDVLLQGTGDVTDLHKFEVIPSEEAWEGGAEGISAMSDWAEEVGDPTLVILDTLAKVEPDAEEGDRYRKEYAMMARYKSFADRYNCAVVAVHHDRKSREEDGDVFTRISGTRGLTGAVDTMFYLDRKRGEATGTLHITGREVPDQELGIKKMGPLWVLNGPEDYPVEPFLRVV